MIQNKKKRTKAGPIQPRRAVTPKAFHGARPIHKPLLKVDRRAFGSGRLLISQFGHAWPYTIGALIDTAAYFVDPSTFAHHLLAFRVVELNLGWGARRAPVSSFLEFFRGNRLTLSHERHKSKIYVSFWGEK